LPPGNKVKTESWGEPLVEKSVLVAVDDAVHTHGVLRYAVRMRSVVHGMGLTLIHVQPAISQFLRDEANHSREARAGIKKIAARNAADSQALLDRHKAELIRAGVEEAGIQLVSLPRSQGLAKDLLDYAQIHLFDAILIGRRGLSTIVQMLLGSVSDSVVANSRLVPIWLVDGEVNSESILAAVDGSENSLRAVDHLAFMLAGNTAARVCFFHVTPRLRDHCAVDLEDREEKVLEDIIVHGDKRCMDNFFGAAMSRLKQAGIAAEQIDVKTVASARGVGNVIVKAATRDGFGTIVMGRRGMAKAFFSGSVSHDVMRKLENAALWLVP
jgi:nucleotide-binding universal stress UspA family protein